MKKTVYLNRKEKSETAKAQIFYVLVSLFDGMVISFLTIFLNQCARDLSWSNTMSSFSLFLPPFVAAISLFICSHFVAEQKKNLKIIGLAKGYDDAIELTQKIIEETYQHTGDVDVWSYLKEERRRRA